MSALLKNINKRGKSHTRMIRTRYKLNRGKKQIRRYGFWFVDIPRTSSTSILAEIGKKYGPPYGKAKLITNKNLANELPIDYFEEMQQMKPHVNRIFDNHIPAIEIQKMIGKKLWKEIFTFTFVRNPWDRMLSLYFFRKQIGDIPNDMQFRKYIQALSNFQRKAKGSLFRNRVYYLSASDYILGANEEILVNFVGKYENRNVDIKTIAHKFGYTNLGTLDINKSTHKNKHYTEYYDHETHSIVHEIYRKDIELFGYKFES